ncbi:hypothetical protein Hanom_Chr17g01548451 [Helianthus anomalus]
MRLVVNPWSPELLNCLNNEILSSPLCLRAASQKCDQIFLPPQSQALKSSFTGVDRTTVQVKVLVSIIMSLLVHRWLLET